MNRIRLTLALALLAPAQAMAQVDLRQLPEPAVVESAVVEPGEGPEPGARPTLAAIGAAQTVDRILAGDGGAAAWEELAAQLEPPINPSGLPPAAQRVAIAIADSAVAAGLVEVGLPVEPSSSVPVWDARQLLPDLVPIGTLAAGLLFLFLAWRWKGRRRHLSARDRVRVRSRLSRQLRRGRTDPGSSHDAERLAAWVRSRAA